MSTFVTLLHQELSSKVVLPPYPSPTASPVLRTVSNDALRTYFAELNPPVSLADAETCINALHHFDANGDFAGLSYGEDEALRTVILVKLLIGLYVQTLELYLDEASDVETQLEWWADIERSRLRSAYYLLQSEFSRSSHIVNIPERGTSFQALPSRVANIADTVIRTLRSQNLPLRLSSLTPGSLRQLFPSRTVLRPHTLTIALFPHLSHEPYPASLLIYSHAKPNLTFSSERVQVEPVFQWLHTICSRVSQSFYRTLTLPVELSRHECRYKRKLLEDIRDDRASVLGDLLELRDDLGKAAETAATADRIEFLQSFVDKFRLVVDRERQDVAKAEVMGPTEFSFVLTDSVLPEHISSHNQQVVKQGLRKPSRLTRYWPRLVFLPPVVLLGIRWLYNSRDSFKQTATDAADTLKAFWDDWLLGPLKEVVKTVRTGSDEGVIITKESVKSDLEVSSP